jgi:hypothetical protein
MKNKLWSAGRDEKGTHELVIMSGCSWCMRSMDRISPLWHFYVFQTLQTNVERRKLNYTVHLKEANAVVA